MVRTRDSSDTSRSRGTSRNPSQSEDDKASQTSEHYYDSDVHVDENGCELITRNMQRTARRATPTGRRSHDDLSARTADNMRGRAKDRYEQPWSGGKDRQRDRSGRHSWKEADDQGNWRSGKRKNRSKSDRRPYQLPRTRDDQWRAPPLKYENNRDDRLDALIANTRE